MIGFVVLCGLLWAAVKARNPITGGWLLVAAGAYGWIWFIGGIG